MSLEQQEQLDDLTKHPGWQLFKEHARKQWGPEGYGRKMKQALAINNGIEQAVTIRSVDYASTEINALLTWPEAMAKKKPEERELSMQRGGA